MMNQSDIHDYLLTYADVWVDTPFGDDTLVYKIGHSEAGKDPFFAIIDDGSRPVRLSLRCDWQLAEILRTTYETVLPGHNLNQKNWNTILCTGQVPENELHDFIRLSYQLADVN